MKLKEFEDKHNQRLREWKEQLKFRKMVSPTGPSSVQLLHL